MTNEESLRSLKVYKGLVEVSALINAITDFNELLAAILNVATRVMEAEAGSLFLTNAEGNLVLEIASGTGGIQVMSKDNKIVVPRGQGVAGWVLQHRQSALVKDAYADSRFYQEVDKRTGFRTRSILCVPLLRNQTEIGVLQILNPAGRDAFNETDLEAFEAYGVLAATAIDKLRTIERQKEQARVDQELNLAREIQKSFLPEHLPELHNLHFKTVYQPALNIGGDFYDVLEVGPDELYFVIGDVSGKGIPAALLMAQSLSSLRYIVKPDISPVDALTRWNEILCGHTIRGMFITAILGRITPSRRLVEISSAGHCQPICISAGGEAQVLEVKNSPPLGIMGGLQYHLTTRSFSPKEWLVFYTDGLTESFDEQSNLLGTEGVEKILSNRKFATAGDVAEQLLSGEQAHRGNASPHDDLTIVVFGFR